MKRINPKDQVHLRMMLYGQPGSTKTRTAASATFDARLRPVLMVNASGNPIAIRDYDPQPDILELERLDELDTVYYWVRAGQPDCAFQKGLGLARDYKTLIIDGTTEIQRFSFNQQRGPVGPGSFPAKVERQHFYNTLGQMVTFAKLFYDLPMNVLMTSLEASDRDEGTGELFYHPLLWGQSEGEVCGYAYVVARMVHRAILKRENPAAEKALVKTDDPQGAELVSVALFTPTGKYYAKDQYGALGTHMINPTMTKIMDLITGKE